MAELGITVTTNGVTQAITDLERLAPAAQKAEAATEKMARSTSQAMAQTASQVETFADRINKAMNIKSGGIDFGRGEDIAAYGRELDRLQAKWAPAAAAMQQYRQGMDEIRRAQAVGAISIGQMDAAMDKHRANIRQVIAAEKQLQDQRNKPGGLAPSGGASAGANKAMQANMMYQMQDIVMTAGMGMNPAMIALQQGGQIAGSVAAAGGGVKASLLAMGQGVMGLMNPVGLATMAVVGLGAAFYQWLSGADEKTKTLEDTTKDYVKAVDAIGKAYSGAGKSVADFGRESEKVMQSILAYTKQEQTKKVEELGKSLFGMNSGGFFNKNFLGGDIGSETINSVTKITSLNVDKKFKDFNAPLQEFYQGLKSGHPDVVKFENAIADLGQELGKTELGGEILEKTKQLRELSKQLQATAADTIAFEDKLSQLQINRDDARTNQEKLKAVQELAAAQNDQGKTEADRHAISRALRQEEARQAREARDAAQAREDGIKRQIYNETANLEAMKRSSVEGENLKQRAAAIRDIYEEAAKNGIMFGSEGWKAYQKQIDAANRLYDELLKVKKEQEEINRLNQRAQTDAQIASMNARTNAEKLAAAGQAARVGKVGRDADTAEAEAARLEVARQAHDAAEATRQRTENLDNLVRKQQEQVTLIGKTAGEQAALNQQFELEYQLKKEAAEKGIAVSQQELDLIKQKTEEYGKLVDEANRLKLIDDLRFERSQTSLSKSEQAIASRLRGTGIGMNSPEAAYMRETERIKESKEFAYSTAKDFLSGMETAITDGGDNIGKALVKSIYDSTQRALSNILDKLLDNILNTVFFGSGGGAAAGANSAGGILGALTGGAQGGGGGFQANTTLSAFLGLGGTAANMNSSLAQSAAAIRMVESGSYAGNYNALGPLTRSGDRAYGAYQMMGNNIPSWSKQALGYSMTPQEFLGNKGAQDTIFEKIFGGYQNKWGPQKAANAWFTGSPTGGGSDVLGTSAGGYVEKFNKALEGATKTVESSVTNTLRTSQSVLSLGKSSTDAVSGISTLGQGAGKLGSILGQGGGAAGGGGGGIFSWLSNLFGFGGAAVVKPASAAFNVRTYHQGNMGPSTTFRSVGSMEPWLNAPRLHSGNIVPMEAGEYPAILRTGEPVFPSIQAAADFGGKGKTTVNVHNYAGAVVKTKETEGPQGMTVDVMVDKVVAQQIDHRGTASNNAIRNKFGISERLKMR